MALCEAVNEGDVDGEETCDKVTEGVATCDRVLDGDDACDTVVDEVAGSDWVCVVEIPRDDVADNVLPWEGALDAATDAVAARVDDPTVGTGAGEPLAVEAPPPPPLQLYTTTWLILGTAPPLLVHVTTPPVQGLTTPLDA